MVRDGDDMNRIADDFIEKRVGEASQYNLANVLSHRNAGQRHSRSKLERLFDFSIQAGAEFRVQS